MSGETTITLVGNVCGDPELKFLPSGAACASFTIASTPRTYDKSSGDWKDQEPLFMRCTAWRQMAESISESLVKGTRVIAQGRLRQRSFETRDGEKRTVMEMEVDEIGPSLKFASAKVSKVTREGSESRGNGGRATSKAGRGSYAGESEPPPF